MLRAVVVQPRERRLDIKASKHVRAVARDVEPAESADHKVVAQTAVASPHFTARSRPCCHRAAQLTSNKNPFILRPLQSVRAAHR